MDNLSRKPVGDQLTQRELEILCLVTDGLSNQDIAGRLFITLTTVKWYLRQIYSKLHVRSRTQAIAMARASGLLDGKSMNDVPSIPPHNLPLQPTPFIGRTRELAAISRRLQDPTCRLLTVVGPGGIGKTRLALQAAEQQRSAFAQGVYFVSLAPLSAPESIVSTLAEVIHFSFYPGREPRLQLLDYLRARRMLLVLDSFEHLLAGVSLVADILETAPRVKMLITSRERLNLQAETLFSVDGMAYPPPKLTGEAAEYDAVKLVLQSVAQVQPDFPTTVDNLCAVANICRLVQGMPLAILLAASWAGVLSVQEIAEQIQQSLNILETDQRDVPERQRSLRAAFDHSWRLLTEDERDVFKGLSVFRGTFSRDAAEKVAGASLKVLLALVNKSLLHRVALTGCFEIHELLRQYAEEQLNASSKESACVRALHCAYYADYMRQQWRALLSRRQVAVLDQIGAEINNVLLAWNYAIRERRTADLTGMALSLWYFWDLRAPYMEAADLFGRAAAALESAPPTKETEILLGHMLARQAWFSVDAAPRIKALLEKSLGLLRKHDCPEEMVIALLTLAHKSERGPDQVAGRVQAAEEALGIARKWDITWGIMHSLAILGDAVKDQGDYARAWQIGEECLKATETSGDLWIRAVNSIFVLGDVALKLKDYAEAERQFELGLRWFKEVGQLWGIGASFEHLGIVALSAQDFVKAKYWLHQALGYLKESGQHYQYGELLYYIAKLFVAQERTEDSVELLSLVRRQANDQVVRGLAATSLMALQADLRKEAYAAAVERGKALDLDEVVAELLQNA